MNVLLENDDIRWKQREKIDGLRYGDRNKILPYFCQ